MGEAGERGEQVVEDGQAETKIQGRGRGVGGYEDAVAFVSEVVKG